ncbi:MULTISPECIES: DUF3782 domain-containing protein [unclassified Synechocystis]|uniref:DUF3782 domain-containing protein n=1 Tax=unclassified Synechocystis TaxID=2640012 RepID=UPI00048F3DE6|nr:MULTISPECIES: DUF3782 domain-containing protein [unclassified Synechocystis]AIE75680.1 hypothetical protein D082_31520 [Synechocystis sp. PCC 6714]MCT0253867.1 DUF3782 domain-containing protein [Synechocystis sp. CS-94]
MATTADEVWQLLAELVQTQKETERLMREKSQETDRRFQETDRQIQELGKQIGGLGKKFGSFTEGLALPSMETILYEKFAMEVVTPSVRASKQGKHIELDVMAYANGDVKTAIVVEVKSHARPESIGQLINHLQRFREFFPEHQDKKLYGILAAVDLSNALREEVLKAGLYAARIRDEIFELDTPATFQPRVW